MAGWFWHLRRPRRPHATRDNRRSRRSALPGLARAISCPTPRRRRAINDPKTTFSDRRRGRCCFRFGAIPNNPISAACARRSAGTASVVLIRIARRRDHNRRPVRVHAITGIQCDTSPHPVTGAPSEPRRDLLHQRRDGPRCSRRRLDVRLGGHRCHRCSRHRRRAGSQGADRRRRQSLLSHCRSGHPPPRGGHRRSSGQVASRPQGAQANDPERRGLQGRLISAEHRPLSGTHSSAAGNACASDQADEPAEDATPGSWPIARLPSCAAICRLDG